MTVVRAQQPAAAMATAMAFQSCSTCGSPIIQATPMKAMIIPIRAYFDSRSRSSRKANSAVNGIQSCAATETGLTSWARAKARKIKP